MKFTLLLPFFTLLTCGFLVGQTGEIELLKDINPGSSNAISLSYTKPVTFNGNFYFVAKDDSDIAQIWRTDGSKGNTKIFGPFAKSRVNPPRNLCTCNNRLFFTTFVEKEKAVLWSSDGTKKGTKLIAEGKEGDYLISGNEICTKGGLIFMRKSGPWVTDGTKKGNKSLGLPHQSSTPVFSLFSKSTNYSYWIERGYHDGKTILWMSDGTPGGTKILADADNSQSIGKGMSNLIIGKQDTLIYTFDNKIWKAAPGEVPQAHHSFTGNISAVHISPDKSTLHIVTREAILIYNQGQLNTVAVATLSNEAALSQIEKTRMPFANFSYVNNQGIFIPLKTNESGYQLYNINKKDGEAVLTNHTNSSVNQFNPMMLDFYKHLSLDNGIEYFTTGLKKGNCELWKYDTNEDNYEAQLILDLSSIRGKIQEIFYSNALVLLYVSTPTTGAEIYILKE